MASLHQSEKGIYRIRFRYGPPPDNKFQRSLETKDSHLAEGIKADVEETIRLLEQGRIQVPAGVDVGKFILSGGRLQAPAAPVQAVKKVTLEGLFSADDAAMPEGAWERSTRTTEAVHRRHLLKLLGPDLDLLGEGLAIALQTYIRERAKQRGQQGKVMAKTIRKELDTFRATWNRSDLLHGAEFPSLKKLVFPKGEAKGRFQTWDEIEEAIAVGGHTPAALKALWECLFLTRPQVEEFLTFALGQPAPDWLYPCLVFVVDTGARRSEVLRSRREDFLKSGEVRVRERKRDPRNKETQRHVPITPRLAGVIRDWFDRHPGGPFVLSTGGQEQLTWQTATKAFRRLVKGSRWENVRGFHVFRHSFASHLAAAGTSQSLIDEWMGHQTETMRNRYRHLFPDERQRALAALTGQMVG
jgi:integrase